MQITKSFDVKISIVYPYLTKNISAKDSERISRSTLFKYETQKNISSPQLSSEATVTAEVTNKTETETLVKRMKKVYDNFDQMRILAEKELNKVLYSYDTNAIEDEAITDAAEELFGFADGSVTFTNYKSALELEKIIQEEISRRAMIQEAA